MSRTFRVSVQTRAYADVTVRISDEQLTSCALQHGIPICKLTVEHLEEIIESTYETPSICAQCSGWGRPYSLELGETWELAESYPEYPAIVEQ